MFWTVQRTEDRRAANLVLQPVAVTLAATVTLPLAKKARKTWLPEDLPCPRFLVNPHAIEKHTRLVALEDHLVRAAIQKDKAEKEKGKANENKGKKKAA